MTDTDQRSETTEGTGAESPASATQREPTANTGGGDRPRFHITALTLSGVGLALSLVLEQLHVQTHQVPNAEHFCTVGSTFDCAAVAASPYAIFLGVPWAIWGAIGFVALAIASYKRSSWLLPLAGVSALTSVALFLLSITVVGSVCLLCEAVHLVSIALFVVAYRSRHQLTGNLKDSSAASTILALPAGLALAAVLVLPPYWSAFSYKAEPPFPTGTTAEGLHWIGSEHPEVTIHEYVNYRCPFCKIGSARSLRKLAKHRSWRVVRHPQPLSGCPEGTSICHSDRMAYCAGKQDKFWRADRWLFAHAGTKTRFDEGKMVADLELNPQAFDACYNSIEAYKFNSDAYHRAREKGFSGVPAYEIEATGGIPAELKELEAFGPKKKPTSKKKPAPEGKPAASDKK